MLDERLAGRKNKERVLCQFQARYPAQIWLERSSTIQLWLQFFH
jgi:hypothetical protein